MSRNFPVGLGIYKNSGFNVVFKCIYGLLVLLLFSFFSVPSLAQITTVSNGAWNSGSTWTGGSVPAATDDAVVNHSVTIDAGTTAEINNLTIGSSGKLIIEGILIVYGNLTMVNNDPELITGSESSVFIFGNAVISNKVNINLSSYFIVLGDFTISGGGGTEINLDEASIYVFGDFDVNADKLKLEKCDEYDNHTNYPEEQTCNIGTEAAFEDNVDEGLIPPEVLERLGKCAKIDVSVIEPVEICNAASGVAGYHAEEATTEVAFVVTMTTTGGSSDSTWEFSFTLSSATGATYTDVSDGTNLLVDDSGTYIVTGLTSQSGTGSVTILMNVTGSKYIKHSVEMEITSALELKCNFPAVDDDQWMAVQIINAIPETSEINTD